MTTTAAFYVGDRTFEVREVPPVPPGPGEVRIDVAYTGICGTDLHVLHGAMDHRVQPPGVIGHEMSGRVAELGAGVTDWSVGQAVTVMPLLWCGRCAACRAGHQHVCQRLTFVGIDSPGAMQRSWTVPADLLVGIPETLPLRHGALIEPTAVAVHDVRRSRLAAGEHAVVIGAGPVGLLIAAVARTLGAHLLLAELDPHRRAVATAMGFTVVDPAADDLAGSVEQWTAGAGAAVVFEVSGSAAGSASPPICWRYAAGWWWWRSMPRPGRWICTASSGVSWRSSVYGSTSARTSPRRCDCWPRVRCPPRN
jgi:(R,R)-butanediol dehydrogenase/meso-butanediol dehydrogenase/diacetyl reductase